MLYNAAVVMAFVAPLLLLACAIDWLLDKLIPIEKWDNFMKW